LRRKIIAYICRTESLKVGFINIDLQVKHEMLYTKVFLERVRENLFLQKMVLP